MSVTNIHAAVLLSEPSGCNKTCSCRSEFLAGNQGSYNYSLEMTSCEHPCRHVYSYMTDHTTRDQNPKLKQVFFLFRSERTTGAQKASFQSTCFPKGAFVESPYYSLPPYHRPPNRFEAQLWGQISSRKIFKHGSQNPGSCLRGLLCVFVASSRWFLDGIAMFFGLFRGVFVVFSSCSRCVLELFCAVFMVVSKCLAVFPRCPSSRDSS